MSSTTLNLKNEIVRAGAGAGKTTLLTKKIFDYLVNFKKENDRWPSVVATTFTKKATQELRERLLLRALETENFELIEYINNSSNLFISTIHGVLNRFLQTYGYLSGIEPGFEVISERQSQQYVKKILKELISEDKDEIRAITNIYNFKQLIRLIFDFNKNIHFETNDNFVLLDDFKNNYYQKRDDLQKNIKSICESIKAEIDNEKWLVYSDKFIKLSQANFVNGIDYSLAVKEIGSKPRKGKGIPETINDELALCLKVIKESFSKPAYQESFWLENENLNRSFEVFYKKFNQRYEKLKVDSSILEINDLELITYKIVNKTPELARLFSAQWNYWLIDEYQDTSPIQVKILDIFVGNSPSFVVGDPQQSIYLFRGARSEVFTEQEKKVKSSGGDLNFLKKNYRSQPELLLFFNDFFKKIGSQFSPMHPRKEAEDNKKIVAQIAQLPICNDEDAVKDQYEFNFIVENIINLVNKGVNYDDICILSRTNKYLTKIAQELRKHNLPINLFLSGGFSERREILDALMFLKFLVNPYDDVNLIGLLRTPWFNIDDSVLVNILHDRKSCVWNVIKEKLEDNSVVKSLKLSLKSSYKFGVTYVFKNDLLSSEFIDYSLSYDSTGRRESNFWKLVQKLSDAERKPGFNYIDFINKIIGETDKEILSEESDAIAALEPNCINLMTVHASKGLQYKHVFIPQAHKKPSLQISSSKKDHLMFNAKMNKWSLYSVDEEGKLSPGLFHIDYVKELEKRELLESQRLLYVSLTRASECVYFSYIDKIESNSWASFLEEEEQGLKNTDYYSYYKITDPVESVESVLVEKSNLSFDENLAGLDSSILKAGSTRSKISVSEVLDKKISVVNSRSEDEIKDSFESLNKANQGTLLHKVFELLKYHDLPSVKKLIGSLFPDNSKVMDKGLDYIAGLESPNLLNLIKDGQVEWGFQLKNDDELIEGQVDLWGIQDDQVWIVDYKSGSESFVEKAFIQLEYYAKAIKPLVKGLNINLLVVYPLSQKTYVKKI